MFLYAAFAVSSAFEALVSTCDGISLFPVVLISKICYQNLCIYTFFKCSLFF